jgi:hypothetical protein
MEQEEANSIKSLIENGYVEAAQSALEKILEANPRDMQAWTLYVKSWNSIDKQIKALELCQKHNPTNSKVQQALTNLRNKAKSAAQSIVTAPRPVGREEDAPSWMQGLRDTSASPTPQNAESAFYESAPKSWEEPKSEWESYASEKFDQPFRMSKEEIDQQAREYMDDRVKATRDLGRPMAWYEVWLTALTQLNTDAYESLRLNPYALPSRTYIWLLSAGMISGLIGVLGLTLNSQYSVAISILEQTFQTPNLGQTLGALFFCLIPLSGVMVLISTAISVGVLHLLASAFGGNGKYSEFLYLVAAFSAPLSIATTIIVMIPYLIFCLFLPLVIYLFILYMQAIKSAHGLDTIRAVGVIVSLFVVNLVIYGAIGWIVYTAIALYIPAQPF